MLLKQHVSNFHNFLMSNEYNSKHDHPHINDDYSVFRNGDQFNIVRVKWKVKLDFYFSWMCVAFATMLTFILNKISDHLCPIIMVSVAHYSVDC